MAKTTQTLSSVTKKLTSRSAIICAFYALSRWFADAFVQGDAEALSNLGCMHEYGYGVAAGLRALFHLCAVLHSHDFSAYPIQAFAYYWFVLRQFVFCICCRDPSSASLLSKATPSVHTTPRAATKMLQVACPRFHPTCFPHLLVQEPTEMSWQL